MRRLHNLDAVLGSGGQEFFNFFLGDKDSKSTGVAKKAARVRRNHGRKTKARKG